MTLLSPITPHVLCSVQPAYLGVNCSATSDGGDVVITCLRIERSELIESIDYSINGGTVRRGEG